MARSIEKLIDQTVTYRVRQSEAMGTFGLEATPRRDARYAAVAEAAGDASVAQAFELPEELLR